VVQYFNGNLVKHTVGIFNPFTVTSSYTVKKGDKATLVFATPITATSVRIVVLKGWNAMNAGLLDTCLPCAAGKSTCSNTTSKSAICVDCIAGKNLDTYARYHTN